MHKLLTCFKYCENLCEYRSNMKIVLFENQEFFDIGPISMAYLCRGGLKPKEIFL